ncbi:TnsA endonuclease C-terminal domain-containing protein [Paenibacillus sp. JTLBN-2024]
MKLRLLIDLLDSGDGTIREVIERFDVTNQSERGEGLLLFKHLLATKQAKIDMDKPIDLNQSVEQVTVNSKGCDQYIDAVGH